MEMNSPPPSQKEKLPTREILNIDEAANLLGVSVKTFSKVLREGSVPGRKVGREWKFSRQALIDWVGEALSRESLDAPEGKSGPAGSAQGPRRSSRRSPTDAVTDGFSVDDL